MAFTEIVKTRGMGEGIGLRGKIENYIRAMVPLRHL